MTITGQSSLSKDQIGQMIKDAEAHAAEDSARRAEAEARNKGENLVYQTEKLLREQGDKIAGDDKSAVESRLAELKSALGASDVDAITSSTELLMSASQQFTQKLYEQAAADERSYAQAGSAGGGGSAGSSQPADDEVVDAEIVDDEAS